MSVKTTGEREVHCTAHVCKEQTKIYRRKKHNQHSLCDVHERQPVSYLLGSPSPLNKQDEAVEK